MKKTKLKNTIALGLTGLGLAVGSANAAVLVDFGNNPSATQLVQTTAIASINETGVGEASAFTSGTFTTSGGTITFDLNITALNGGIIGQDLGFGVDGGSAAKGLDNNDNSGPLESMTFAISNFTNLGTGETLEILGVSVLFADTSEFYTINGGSSTLFSANSTGGNPAEFISVSGTAVTFGAGSGASTAFAIDGITVGVVAVPEPSSTALLGLGGLALILRRRRD